jgi:hypothetical protein
MNKNIESRLMAAYFSTMTSKRRIDEECVVVSLSSIVYTY